MAVVVTIPIYRINQTPFEAQGTRYYRDFALGAAGLAVQPVAHPHNVVNGAIIYSQINHPSYPNAALYSNLTVAAIVTLANA
jgi:hypothetical protein